VNLLRPRGASPELARVLGGLANACHGSGKLPLAEQLYDEACAMDTTGSIVLRVNRAMLYMDSRGHSAALHMTEELVQECRRSGNRYALASVLVNHGILLHRLPDAPAARAAYLEAGKLARELGLRLVEQVSLSNLSVLNFNQQGPAAALGDTRRSLELAREIGDRRGVVTALVNLAAVQDKLGQVRHGSMREANTLARRIGDPILRITVLIQRGLAAAARNRQGAAWRILERAEHLVRRSGLHADSQAASQTQLLRKELLDRQHRA
jgi:tetratricopeptide (TPR) repeat protein